MKTSRGEVHARAVIRSLGVSPFSFGTFRRLPRFANHGDVPMATGDQYRIKAAEFHAEAQRATNRGLRRQFENLSRAYLLLAGQSDRNARIELVYEPPPPKLTEEPRAK